MKRDAHNFGRDKIQRIFFTSALIVAATILVGGLFLSTQHNTFTSAEVKFTDASPRGLAIVPASCPSVPSNPDYPHDTCATQTASGTCTIRSTLYVTSPGQPITLQWATANWGVSIPRNGTLTPGLGTVSPSGALTLNPGPSETTQYRLSGTYRYPYFDTTTGDYWCYVTVTVTPNGCPIGYSGTPPNCTLQPECPVGYVVSDDDDSLCVFESCPTGYTLSGGECVFTACPAGYALVGGQCARTTCPAGYTVQDGKCIPPLAINFVPFPATNSNGPFTASGHLQVIPALVKSDTKVQVYWNVVNALNCSVTSNNGDSWSTEFSGAAGQTSKPITAQTVFTLACTALPGAIPSSIHESQSVNIIPIFNEL